MGRMKYKNTKFYQNLKSTKKYGIRTIYIMLKIFN